MRCGSRCWPSLPAVAAVAVFMATSSPSDTERPAASTATATTQPPVGTWTPAVGWPEKNMPMSIDRTPVSPTATKVLAVLRRPQTDRDRRLAGPRLRYVGPPGEGLQVDGVRALNARYALVPLNGTGPCRVRRLHPRQPRRRLLARQPSGPPRRSQPHRRREVDAPLRDRAGWRRPRALHAPNRPTGRDRGARELLRTAHPGHRPRHVARPGQARSGSSPRSDPAGT